jgi:translation initiation factor IF-3
VLLIDPDGKQLGIKPLPEALNIARQLDLDLVEVAADANPPVARVMDYNRFKYEAAQRAKESRRKSTTTGIKEMKYRPKIGSGDFDTKTRQVSRFLGEGHKVKVTIMFRGREMSHPELGKRILDQVAENVAGIAKVEAAPKLDGRNMIMVLAPDRRAQQVRKPSPNGAAPEGNHENRSGRGTTQAGWTEEPSPPTEESNQQPTQQTTEQVTEHSSQGDIPAAAPDTFREDVPATSLTQNNP